MLGPWLETFRAWRKELEGRLSSGDRQRVEGERIYYAADRRLVGLAGVYRRRPGRIPHEIRFSAWLFPDELRGIFVHEFAHFCVGILYGRHGGSDGHGWEWQLVSRILGREPERYIKEPLPLRKLLAHKFPSFARQLWLSMG